MPKTTTKPGYPARICKRPRVGESVATRFGGATITKVHGHGRRLEVATSAHGNQIVERAPHAHWTIRTGENLVA